ncbi:MAG TPA: HAD-IA family hydrolase [Acidimicrobiales bacterium]|nr:HAD-IA family hydrolase [Acidimicrobiales bacterium]
MDGLFPGACLVLDFDGTILDTEAPVYQSWAELWAEQGVELARGEWQSVIGTDAGFDPWAELETRLGRRVDPSLAARRRARRDELQLAYEPREGVLAWLEEADALGVPVAIASSSPVEWVEGHLARLGLRPRFAVMVCRDEIVPPKPDPTSYREACLKLGADPRRSVAVEDSVHGVAAAVAAGLYTVAVPHGLTDDLDLSAADLVTTTLEGLSLAAVLAKAARRDGAAASGAAAPEAPAAGAAAPGAAAAGAATPDVRGARRRPPPPDGPPTPAPRGGTTPARSAPPPTPKGRPWAP